jgi:hypothetical protein
MSHRSGFVVDHINRNSLDNRRCNLRYISHSENLANSDVRSDSTTGFKGVSPHSRRKGVFTTWAWVNGRKYFVGNYPSAEVAAKARSDFINNALQHPEQLPSLGQRKNGSSNVRGVTKARGGKWTARVMKHGKSHYLGTFSTVQAAADAVARGRLELNYIRAE